MADREVLTRAIKSSWSATTSAHRWWKPENPALGQSGVTSRAVQTLLGGEIMHQTVQVGDGERWAHFSNVVEGETVDLTVSQYGPEVVFIGEKEPITAQELAADYGVTVRYDTPMGNVSGILFELAHSRRPGDLK